MFSTSEEAINKFMTSVPKVTNEQHLQNNTVGSHRLNTQPMPMGAVTTSNVAGETNSSETVRSVASVEETAPIWGGPNRITGAIRKTPCTIKNSKYNSY
jgi:hypothetical protein